MEGGGVASQSIDCRLSQVRPIAGENCRAGFGRAASRPWSSTNAAGWSPNEGKSRSSVDLGTPTVVQAFALGHSNEFHRFRREADDHGGRNLCRRCQIGPSRDLVPVETMMHTIPRVGRSVARPNEGISEELLRQSLKDGYLARLLGLMELELLKVGAVPPVLMLGRCSPIRHLLSL